jgi:hypothetical protein
VLEPMLALRNDHYCFSYFKYADLVGRRDATISAMLLCRQIVSRIDDMNFEYLRAHISELLKNPKLPLINLLGIHLAQAIAREFGTCELFAVAGAEPQDFFRLYEETSDDLKEHLFGAKGEAKEMFCH